MARDRHGRSRRTDGDPRRRPPDGYRARDTARFRRMAVEAIAGLPRRFTTALGRAELAIEDVPPPPMVTADGEVVLATFTEERLILFRRPIEQRSDSRGTLEETLMLAVAQAVARARGWDDDPDDLLG